MANDAIKEMISAFALGCMDRKNYKQFKNYVQGGGELPDGELGDSQNIISLIPTILDIDNPREELKNELGNRLIEIQKNIKNRVVEDRRETRIEFEDEFLERSSSTKNFDVGEKRGDFSQQSQRVNKTPIPPTRIKEKGTSSTTSIQTSEISKPSSLNIILLWIFSSLLLIAIVVLSYLSFNKTSALEEVNNKLQRQIVKLRTDLSRTNNFINENKEFVEFFNNPNINIIQLKGLEKTSKESGRLLISFDAGEGLLQLQNMPRISSEKVYQLWLVSKTGTFSLGAFEITPDKKYIKFSEIPFVMKEDIQLFRISQEMRGESEMPNGRTILFGSLSEDKPNTKRRR
ncbi:MAG: anti-sigma factor [Melioribacteraceae bacterium]|nr:anti-sigma factor [Melioribacteraceae bacterium]